MADNNLSYLDLRRRFDSPTNGRRWSGKTVKTFEMAVQLYDVNILLEEVAIRERNTEKQAAVQERGKDILLLADLILDTDPVSKVAQLAFQESLRPHVEAISREFPSTVQLAGLITNLNTPRGAAIRRNQEQGQKDVRTLLDGIVHTLGRPPITTTR